MGTEKPHRVMSFERLRPVVWSGELVALAGVERFHIIAPRLLQPDAVATDLEYVALLCLYHRQVLLGALPDRPDPARVSPAAVPGRRTGPSFRFVRPPLWVSQRP